MHVNTIDLNDIRICLDQMAESIVSQFKDRSRLPCNPSVYEPADGRSLLEFTIGEFEQTYAKLGRYEYGDQNTFVLARKDMPKPVIKRTPPKPIIRDVRVDIQEKVMSYYKKFVADFCDAGDDKDTFGQTVTVDAGLLDALFERINIGKFVAESKYQTDPSVRKVINDTEALKKKLTKPGREVAVLDKARDMARRYELDEKRVEMIAKLFRWIIDTTLELEVQYLQKAYGNKKIN